MWYEGGFESVEMVALVMWLSGIVSDRDGHDSCLERWKSVIMKGIAQCMGLKYPSHLPGLECFGQFI